MFFTLLGPAHLCNFVFISRQLYKPYSLCRNTVLTLDCITSVNELAYSGRRRELLCMFLLCMPGTECVLCATHLTAVSHREWRITLMFTAEKEECSQLDCNREPSSPLDFMPGFTEWIHSAITRSQRGLHCEGWFVAQCWWVNIG